MKRHENESVIILCPDGKQIKVIVARDGKAPRLGFEAPDEYKILREELIAKMARKMAT